MGNFNCCQRASQPQAGRSEDLPTPFIMPPGGRPQRFVENWVEDSQRDLAFAAEARRRQLGTNRPDTPLPPLGTRWAGFSAADLANLTFR